MEELLAFILTTWFIVANVFAIQFAILDYREFNHIVKQCEKQGYIQDKTIRVSCGVEK